MGGTGNTDAWKVAEDQLRKYMPIIHARQLTWTGWNHPLYGIVAVGDLVRFYEWVQGQLTFWRGAKKYHITIDARFIHDRLMRIKNNHT
jgi:hypothetical protein